MSGIRGYLSRRDFLKLNALALGSASVAYGAGERLVRLTATVTPQRAGRVRSTLVSNGPPDTILYNGNVITMDSGTPAAQAVAVRDGRILQVGSSPVIQALAGPSTRLIDLTGRTVTPGLIDSHNHLQVWGLMLESFEPLIPPEVRSLDNLLAKLSAAVTRAPTGEWVQGYFWYIDPLPTRYDLDTVAPDNPVWLIQQGGHYGVANSLALDIADITADTEDPEGGVIDRDPLGEPTGILYNHRAMDLLRVHAPQPTSDDVKGYIHFAEEIMAGYGVTTYHDCNARFSAIEGYLQAGREKSLLLRGNVFYTLEWPGDLQRALEEIQYDPDAFMRFAGYKFLIDGQLPTWYTHEPHVGVRWDMPTWEPDNFKNAVRQLHDTGLQVAVHCGGDAAFDLALDAFEAAMNANPRPDPRHRIEHGSLTKPESTRRAADLGVQISAQPQFLGFASAQNLVAQLGEERAARLMVTREWLDAGINVALGSDTPTAPWQKPQVTLLGAIRRADVTGTPFHPEQQLTIQEALHAHTMGSARAGLEEDVKGSLTPGKYADLVVWSGDFYSLSDPLDILDIEAELTMIGGNVVHQANTCAGDCNADGSVSVDELVQGVNIALGNAPVDACTAIDRNDDGSASVDELVAAVGNALGGCSD